MSKTPAAAEAEDAAAAKRARLAPGARNPEQEPLLYDVFPNVWMRMSLRDIRTAFMGTQWQWANVRGDHIQWLLTEHPRLHPWVARYGREILWPRFMKDGNKTIAGKPWFLYLDYLEALSGIYTRSDHPNKIGNTTDTYKNRWQTGGFVAANALFMDADLARRTLEFFREGPSSTQYGPPTIAADIRTAASGKNFWPAYLKRAMRDDAGRLTVEPLERLLRFLDTTCRPLVPPKEYSNVMEHVLYGAIAPVLYDHVTDIVEEEDDTVLIQRLDDLVAPLVGHGISIPFALLASVQLDADFYSPYEYLDTIWNRWPRGLWPLAAQLFENDNYRNLFQLTSDTIFEPQIDNGVVLIEADMPFLLRIANHAGAFDMSRDGVDNWARRLDKKIHDPEQRAFWRRIVGVRILPEKETDQ